MPVKEKCFAYDKANDRCKACKDLKCDECKFYKNKNDQAQRIKPFKREYSGYTVADVVHLFSKN
ncbi:MAG: hypothetical protein AB7V50_03125 [Vampirovibrionia bacterium]